MTALGQRFKVTTRAGVVLVETAVWAVTTAGRGWYVDTPEGVYHVQRGKGG